MRQNVFTILFPLRNKKKI